MLQTVDTPDQRVERWEQEQGDADLSGRKQEQRFRDGIFMHGISPGAVPRLLSALGRKWKWKWKNGTGEYGGLEPQGKSKLLILYYYFCQTLFSSPSLPHSTFSRIPQVLSGLSRYQWPT